MVDEALGSPHDDQRFAERTFDDTQWAKVAIPSEWTEHTVGAVSWYRVHTPCGRASEPQALYIGRATGAFEVFLNGRRIATGGRIASWYISRYGPTEVIALPPELREHDDCVIAVRMLNTWLGGFAFDPIRLGDPGALEMQQGSDLARDRLFHAILLTVWVCLALALLTLMLLGQAGPTMFCGIAVSLCGIQWTVYQSSLANSLGRSVFWEGLDMSSNFLAGVAGSLIPILQAKIAKRSDAWMLGAWALFSLVPLLVAPRWALQHGLWTAAWIALSGWCLYALGRLFKAHRRFAVDPLLGAMAFAALALVFIEVAGMLFELAPLAKRFMSDVVLVGWIGILVLVGLRQHRRDRRRLRQIPAELLVARDFERKHLARELHDGVGQELQLAKLQLHALKNAQDTAMIDELADQLTHTLGELRALTRGLDEEEAPTDLVDRLVALAASVTACSATTVVVDATPDLAVVDPEAGHHLFRIVQQALSNALEHGRAGEISVRLHSSAHGVELTIADDGDGFDLGAAAYGLGLSTMRERAAALGGSCEVSSSAAGTEVAVRLPPRGDRTARHNTDT